MPRLTLGLLSPSLYPTLISPPLLFPFVCALAFPFKTNTPDSLVDSYEDPSSPPRGGLPVFR